MKRIILALLAIGVFACRPGICADTSAAATSQSDVLIYGLTSSGVIAAIEAASHNKHTILIGPDSHLGGMTSQGLGWTDIGEENAIGGLARQFYQTVAGIYCPTTKTIFGSSTTCKTAFQGYNLSSDVFFNFEPHIAEQAFNQMVNPYTSGTSPLLTVVYRKQLSSVVKSGTLIHTVVMADGSQYSASVFIDASYEGDLMAAAGVSNTVGREASATYNENWIYTNPTTGKTSYGNYAGGGLPYRFVRVDNGQNISGPATLPLTNTDAITPPAAGDAKVQAYNYRFCLTNNTNQNYNQHITGYPSAAWNKTSFALLGQYIRSFPKKVGGVCSARECLDDLTLSNFMILNPIPNFSNPGVLKTDVNSFKSTPISTDFVGQSWSWATSSTTQRATIAANHQNYDLALLYYLGHDSPLTPGQQSSIQQYGLCKDEFTDNNAWPHQLYVREARRMIGEKVITANQSSNDLLNMSDENGDSVGLASYGIDSHFVDRSVMNPGTVNADIADEGYISTPPTAPTNYTFSIPYGAIVPKVTEVGNLIVPVAVSASHVGYSVIRMEPTYMILGQAAGAAASLAIYDGEQVQDIPMHTDDNKGLQDILISEHQVLSWDGSTALQLTSATSSISGFQQHQVKLTWPSSADYSYYHVFRCLSSTAAQCSASCTANNGNCNALTALTVHYPTSVSQFPNSLNGVPLSVADKGVKAGQTYGYCVAGTSIALGSGPYACVSVTVP